MERLTGRRGGRGERTQAAGKKHTVSNRTEKNVREGIKKKKSQIQLSLFIISLGESRGSAGVSVLQPHSQHHHCEHHQSPQPQSHGHRRHFWYRCSFILHVLSLLPFCFKMKMRKLFGFLFCFCFILSNHYKMT